MRIAHICPSHGRLSLVYLGVDPYFLGDDGATSYSVRSTEYAKKKKERKLKLVQLRLARTLPAARRSMPSQWK